MNKGGIVRDVFVAGGLKVHTGEAHSCKRKENISNTRSSIAMNLALHED